MLAEALVQVRTPTYRRPEALHRCLRSLQAQTWQNWVCDVYDDDPERSARAVCNDLGDPRIFYNHNDPQEYASRNIDKCFSRENPRQADYFCVVEDDNYILPEFMQANVDACRRLGVELMLRNQYVEFDSGTPEAKLSDFGIFDEMFVERIYEPEEFRLSLIPGIGVSNGAIFWSRDATSQLEIGYACTATLQEYMRTYSVTERLYVAKKPLAVWAQNGEQTTRDLGATASYLKRELDLKRAIQTLQREAWRGAGDKRRDFINSQLFAYPAQLRARGLAKALIPARTGEVLGAREKLELAWRGLLIRAAGRVPRDFHQFLLSRNQGRVQPDAPPASFQRQKG
jgi:glycosyltransferase involved in cell wall biosynthesis